MTVQVMYVCIHIHIVERARFFDRKVQVLGGVRLQVWSARLWGYGLGCKVNGAGFAPLRAHAIQPHGFEKARLSRVEIRGERHHSQRSMLLQRFGI